jgi:hypothetical protein
LKPRRRSPKPIGKVEVAALLSVERPVLKDFDLARHVAHSLWNEPF